MPELGMVARGIDVDMPAYGYHKMIWAACEACCAERWVALRAGEPVSRWCYTCGRTRTKSPRRTRSRQDHPRWKGGRHISAGGYVQVVVPIDDPMIAMADSRGRIYEHRLVVAQDLGRALTSDEIVHHRNGERQDNRIENLELTTRSAHASDHHDEIIALRRRVQELEHELKARETPPS